MKFILGSVLRPSLLSNRDWARLHICDQFSLSLDMLFFFKSVVAAQSAHGSPKKKLNGDKKSCKKVRVAMKTGTKGWVYSNRLDFQTHIYN